MTADAERDDAFFPGQAGIDAYGNGGFRFADMSHRGSILMLPSGIYAWPVAGMGDLAVETFARVFAEAGSIELLLLGCGADMARPSVAIRDAFKAQGIGLDFMATGAAARTYNVLLAEKRAVAAALIAVDSAR
jgi:uncharacterized protein